MRFANNDFDLVSNEEFIQIRSSAIDSITRNMTGREYLKVLLPNISMLNDEHTEIDFFEFKDIQNQNFFPLSIEIDFINKEFIVLTEYQNIKQYSIINEINGESVSEILQHLSFYFSGVSEAQKENYVSH